MKNNENKFDKILKDKLDGYKQLPSNKVWTGVKNAVFWKNVTAFKFIAGSKILSIISVIGVSSLIIATSLGLFTSSDYKEVKDMEIVKSEKQIIEKSILKNGVIEKKKETANEILVNNFQKSEDSQKLKTKSNNQIVKNEIKQNIANPEKEMEKKDINKQYKIVTIETSREQNKRTVFEKDNITDIIDSNELLKKVLIDSVIAFEKQDTNAKQQDVKNIDGDIIEEKKSPFQITLWESPFYYTNKILTGDGTNGVDDYIGLRDNSEKGMLTYARGLELSYILNNNLIFQSGINYSVFGEKVHYDFSETNYDSIGYNVKIENGFKWEYTYDSSGIIIDSLPRQYVDTTFITLFDTSELNINEKSDNRYKYIEIPILFGKRFYIKKLSIDVVSGLNLGYFISAKGKFLSIYNHEILDISKGNSPFNEMFVYNFLLRLNCSYPLSERIRVSVAPSFKYNLNSMLNKNYPVSQKYYSAGLNFGLIYNF